MEATSNSFEYSLRDFAELEVKHDEEVFLSYADTELFNVNRADEKSEDRLIYGFGDACPLKLAPGVKVCKSFKEKHWSCRSCISSKLAQNYLAKHGHDSSNHLVHHDKKAAFAEANMTKIVDELETPGDRETFRLHCAHFSSQKEQRREEPCEERDDRRSDRREDRRDVRRDDRRDERRMRSRSPAPPPQRQRAPRSAAAIGSRGSGSSSVTTAISVDPLISSNLGAIVHAREFAKTVKVSTAELQTLEGCLGRAMDSHKRTIDALNFFSRQLEDEKKIFSEAKDVINSLVNRARV